MEAIREVLDARDPERNYMELVPRRDGEDITYDLMMNIDNGHMRTQEPAFTGVSLSDMTEEEMRVESYEALKEILDETILDMERVCVPDDADIEDSIARARRLAERTKRTEPTLAVQMGDMDVIQKTKKDGADHIEELLINTCYYEELQFVVTGKDMAPTEKNIQSLVNAATDGLREVLDGIKAKLYEYKADNTDECVFRVTIENA